MKVVIDARLYGIYHRGIGRYLKEILRELAFVDTTNQYIILVNPANPEQPELPRANFLIVKAPWRQYSLAEQIRLPILIKKLRPDVTYFPHFNAPWFSARPFVVTIHDLLINHWPSFRATTRPRWVYRLKVLAYKALIKRVITRAKAVVTVSQAVADDILSSYAIAPDRVKVIYPGLAPLPAGICRLQLPEKYFLAVGAAYPHKNLETLIKAFRLAHRVLPEYKLILVGRPDFFMARLHNYVEQNKLGELVIFWGQASEADLANLYQRARGLILPSLEEGFGFSPLEALLLNTPVAVANIPVEHEVLGPAALYFDPLNINDMARAIVKLARVPHSSNAMTNKLLARYSWPRSVQALLKVIQSTVHG